MTDELTAAVIDSIIQAGLRHNGYGEYLTPETPLREIHFKGGDCERAKLCAEPCADCLYCDERGNL